MDFQTIITNAVKVQREEELKTSPQLTLGEMIIKLETIKNKKLPIVFNSKYYPTGIDSWRGSYCELALEYNADKKLLVDGFLKLLKGTIGKTLTGYKGGDFLMGKITPVWVANHGESLGFNNDEYIGVIDIEENKNEVVIKVKEM